MKPCLFSLLASLGIGSIAPVSPLLVAPVMKVSEFASQAAATAPLKPMAPLPALPPVSKPDDRGLAVPSDPPIVVVPNADAVIDLTGIGQSEDVEPIPNPFRVRYHPQPQIREVPLAISSVLVGENAMDASAIINGNLYSPGDVLEGLSVAAITAETVELRQGNAILQIPVQDKPVTLRLTR